MSDKNTPVNTPDGAHGTRGAAEAVGGLEVDRGEVQPRHGGAPAAPGRASSASTR